MIEGEDYEVVWNGSMPLLPPRETRPQMDRPFIKEKRLYNRKVMKDDDTQTDLAVQEVSDGLTPSMDEL